jgi:single-strand DNA-binding protein
MTQNITITATGNVVNEPVYFEATEAKPAMVSFRLASTPSHFSRKDKEWVNGTTSWFDVNAFGALAKHATKSLKKGDPVVVSGTLRTREWETEDGSQGSSALIRAASLGHDLLRGTSTFKRGDAGDDEIADSIEETVETVPSA